MAAASHRMGSTHSSLEVDKLSVSCQQRRDFRELAGFVIACACTCAHIYAEIAGTSPLSLSLHTSLMLFQILTAAELREAFRLRSISDPNGSKWQVRTACMVISPSTLLHPNRLPAQQKCSFLTAAWDACTECFSSLFRGQTL